MVVTHMIFQGRTEQSGAKLRTSQTMVSSEANLVQFQSNPLGFEIVFLESVSEIPPQNRDTSQVENSILQNKIHL